jgi:hypothetical protein
MLSSEDECSWRVLGCVLCVKVTRIEVVISLVDIFSAPSIGPHLLDGLNFRILNISSNGSKQLDIIICT